MTLLDQLQSFDLSEHEARVYLACLVRCVFRIKT